MKALLNHEWPNPGEHLWGPWMSKRAREGVNKPTQYRQCCHPNCGATEEREAPSA